MDEYEPLDISAYCNAGPAILGDDRTPAVGTQRFYGLPFQVGSDPNSQYFIAFGSESPLRWEPVSLTVGASARWVLFAHAQLRTDLHEGRPPGSIIARYRVAFADGSEETVPIRERFEISVVPVAWGEHPFLAVPDVQDSLMPRKEGAWENTGFRQTEARQAWPRDYYLWAWRNPRPESAIAKIDILPGSGDEGHGGPATPFMVAAITLSHLEEEPFCREAAIPVKIVLAAPEDAAEPFGLEVEVDRGVTTYPYPLPDQPAEEYLQDPQRGWGQNPNLRNSPAYSQIAANPSATVTVKKTGDELGRVNWGDLRASGEADSGRVRFEIVDTGRNWVHTTVLDDDTGKPVPCRVHFRDGHGIPYAPHGHHPHVFSDMGTWHIDVGGDVRLGQISYAYIDGKCQGWLPRGEVIVDVARGYEYESLRTRVEIKPGQRELTLRIKRRHNLNRERYFSGDTHVHFLSTQGALTEAAAEDLDVVNLLLSQWGHLFTSSEEFTGRPAKAGDGETIVYASQENRQHLLGHLTLLGLKEPVMPWCSDGPSEAEMGGNLETTMSYWADACHAQGGSVVIPHLPNPNGEPAALIATGRADAVEFLVHSAYFHLEYYRYLNGGYRLPLVGGTDKMDAGVPVGLYRTYAFIPPDEEFSYDNWCKAMRSGNTFLSGGPVLRFQVDGQPIGSAITLGRDGGTVEIEAAASSIFPIHSLQVVKGSSGGNGGTGHEIVAQADDKNGTRELRIRTTLRIDASTWLCARCAGPEYGAVKHHDSWQRGIMAHTSPIYIACGSYDVFSPETAQYMLTLMDGSLQHIRGRARQWRSGSVTHHHGGPDHQEFLERPFHEAIAAIHRGLHEHGIPH